MLKWLAMLLFSQGSFTGGEKEHFIRAYNFPDIMQDNRGGIDEVLLFEVLDLFSLWALGNEKAELKAVDDFKIYLVL